MSGGARRLGPLLVRGVLAGLFFSATFVLNRAMSQAGGHWVWSAALRYLHMLLLLAVALAATGQGAVLRGALRLFRAHLGFWVVAGGVGCGLFYAPLCLAAAYAPGWVVATTWQSTVLATPLVLFAFGRPVPLRGLAFTALVFLGIALVTLEQAGGAGVREVALGAAPVLLAAFAYPVGNQLVWEARRGGRRWVPHLDDPLLDHDLARVLLLVLGSLPFWLVLGAAVRPPPPSAAQVGRTALVALLSGVVATSLFLSARHRARTAYELAAVDATQATEVIFSVAGEVALLGGAPPGPLGAGGVALALSGLGLYLGAQTRPPPAARS
ncbi:DMT family transporter [Anaeromyxobacter diazotrophicus]|uniref:Membrane protein n=1 Tax=Anaeromyxobacter diazotrophicus TaxID=2590199 RepID=A0A7I9VPF0_9BACT|nr:multidrug resistance efflux transporter family protein [Anaeromyxobacter diazotrophicus]GEJ58108.1 membrane protein [Anaeromyxobacter diazotrophicus]